MPDAPSGDDPYRGSVYRDLGIAACPRCGSSLQEGRGWPSCLRGGGELLPRKKLPRALPIERLAGCEPDVSSPIGRPFPPGRCPLCRRTMEVRLHVLVVFDLCFDHGLWLDRGEREMFEAAFDLALGS
jgi:Zn-finger nucleic acid-binding protein